MSRTITLVTALVVLSSCVTMRLPDGAMTTRPDTEAMIAILQSSVAVAEQALDAYIRFAEAQNRLEDEETQREIQRQRDRVETITALIESLRGSQH